MTRSPRTSCQHALFMLRWLGRAPESFLSEANLPGQVSLSSAEHHLLVDWLDRLAAEPAGE